MTRALLLIRLLALSVALVTSGAIGNALAASPEISLTPPRSHGWWIGDVLTATAQIAVEDGFTLDAASLPRPRTVDYWLQLRASRVKDDGESGGGQDRRHRYVLELEYQTFYAPLEPKRMTVPAVPLIFSRGSERVEGSVPAWTFVTAPLREIRAPSSPESMEPGPPITMIDTVPSRVRALLCAMVGGAALTALAWHRALWPFTRRPRPFAKAARRIGKLSRRGWDAEAARQACVTLHRAFDEALGRRMLADDIAALVRSKPGLALLSADIEAFFSASRLLFFGTAGAALPPFLSGAGLLDLTQGLAAVERRRP